MPRQGWQQFDVPSGSVRVLRGPGPPSERWPVDHHPSSVDQATDCFCQNPPRVQAEPHARSCCFRGSGRGQEVGSSDCSPWGGSMHAKSLHEALRIARARSTLPPVAERVVRAQDVIDKATAQKKIHEEEVAEGERRLAHLHRSV